MLGFLLSILNYLTTFLTVNSFFPVSLKEESLQAWWARHVDQKNYSQSSNFSEHNLAKNEKKVLKQQFVNTSGYIKTHLVSQIAMLSKHFFFDILYILLHNQHLTYLPMKKINLLEWLIKEIGRHNILRWSLDNHFSQE